MQLPSLDQSTLQVRHYASELLETLKPRARSLVIAPTGTGKTIGIPWLAAQQGNFEMVYVVLSKRLACKTAAQYLANNIGSSHVGYQTGNETKIDGGNRIRFVTAGVMVRIVQSQPGSLLNSLIIFDEFHERSLMMDLAFAFTSALQQDNAKASIALLVMSASLEGELIAKKLALTLVNIKIEQRHNVQVTYHNAGLGFDRRLAVIPDLVVQQINSLGTTLIFVPGLKEVSRLVRQLSDRLSCPVVGLHGSADSDDVMLAVTPGPMRVIVATNVAESSITIADLDTVIDSGITRLSMYDPTSDSTSLDTQVSSQHSAIQRAGRVGRTKEGRVIRMWGEHQNIERPLALSPDIDRMSLEEALIEARAAQTDFDELLLASKPPSSRVEHAQARLNFWLVDLIEPSDLISLLSLGIRFRYALTLATVSGGELEHWLLYISYLIMLEERQVVASEHSLDRVDFSSLPSSFSRQLNRLRARYKKVNLAAVEVAQQDWLDVWLDRLAVLNDSGRLMSSGAVYAVNDDNVDAAVVLQQLGMKDPLQAGAYKSVSRKLAWQRLDEHLSTSSEQLLYNPKTGRAQVQITRCWGRIEDKSINKADLASAWLAVKQHLRSLTVEQDSDLQQAINRINAYLTYCKEPSITWQHCCDQLHWLEPWFESTYYNQPLTQKRLAATLISSWFDYSIKQRFDVVAPKQYKLPTGSAVDIVYDNEGRLMVTAIVQQLFGVTSHPLVAGKPLLFNFVSPARRPIQLTADVVGFFKGSYAEVRTEMKSRYPKHYWPQDPLTSAPSNKSIKPRK